MKGSSGIMVVRFPNGQGGTQTIKQDMKLWSSAKGLVIKGENPVDVDTKNPSSTYATDNFLIAIEPNGSLIFRNYSLEQSNNSRVESPVNREFIGYPSIGIRMNELNTEVRDQVNQQGNLPFKITQDTGVLIIEVINDSSAAKAGLKPGDIIISVDGTKVSRAAEVQQLVQSSLFLVDNLNFEIDRNGENMSLSVQPGCCVKPESSQQ
ncbi:PDZ domain-containing protein [Microseira sp. BLCC-F43]|uniref:PDZ domain-containing protein n=1 Tax=Microseira sp. BLCC-F43 TaxID=3153602 RepID=UPI0035B6DBC6